MDNNDDDRLTRMYGATTPKQRPDRVEPEGPGDRYRKRMLPSEKPAPDEDTRERNEDGTFKPRQPHQPNASAWYGKTTPKEQVTGTNPRAGRRAG